MALKGFGWMERAKKVIFCTITFEMLYDHSSDSVLCSRNSLLNTILLKTAFTKGSLNVFLTINFVIFLSNQCV